MSLGPFHWTFSAQERKLYVVPHTILNFVALSVSKVSSPLLWSRWTEKSLSATRIRTICESIVSPLIPFDRKQRAIVKTRTHAQRLHIKKPFTRGSTQLNESQGTPEIKAPIVCSTKHFVAE